MPLKGGDEGRRGRLGAGGGEAAETAAAGSTRRMLVPVVLLGIWGGG